MIVLVYILKGLLYLIIIDAVLSWIQPPSQLPRRATHQVTQMLYAPIHAVIKPQMTGGLDLSPLVWIFGIQFILGML